MAVSQNQCWVQMHIPRKIQSPRPLLPLLGARQSCVRRRQGGGSVCFIAINQQLGIDSPRPSYPSRKARFDLRPQREPQEEEGGADEPPPRSKLPTGPESPEVPSPPWAARGQSNAVTAACDSPTPPRLLPQCKQL